MSVIVSNCFQISHSPVNSSLSKQLYSFSKDERFKSNIKPLCDKYYEIPTTRSKLFATFGIGKRPTIDTKRRAPDPTTYNLPPNFENLHKGNVFTFGIQREAYRKVYIKGNVLADTCVPGPGNYEVREAPGKSQLKYSFRPKTTLESDLKESKTVPGPGTYPLIQAISAKGNQFLSKYSSSKASIFHPPNSVRFKEITTSVRRFPGPGTYNPKTEINKNGSYFISKFRSSLCRTFSGIRDDISQRKSFLNTPGPGTYRTPSEFGHYQAQDKYIKETEKIEKRNIKISSVFQIKNMKMLKNLSCKTIESKPKN